MATIQERLDQIRPQIPSNATLVVVSKYHTVEEIQEAYDAGVRDFGENRVQELVSKVDKLPEDIRWHLIGSLQRNKVKYIAPFITSIQSIESLALYDEVERRAAQHNRTIDCLVEVFVAQEEAKSGVPYDEVESFFEALLERQAEGNTHIRLRGLMGMATHTDSEAEIRAEFAKLRALFCRLKEGLMSQFPWFDTLSMGMSEDWSIALSEGSNMVRIGTAIMGPRAY
jgi:pyridoxal phosphate enzyme, yggS family